MDAGLYWCMFRCTYVIGIKALEFNNKQFDIALCGIFYSGLRVELINFDAHKTSQMILVS